MADLSKGQRHDCKDLGRVCQRSSFGDPCPVIDLDRENASLPDLSARLCWRRITAGSALVNVCLSVDLAGNVLDL